MRYRTMAQHLGKASGNHVGREGKYHSDEAEKIMGERVTS